MCTTTKPKRPRPVTAMTTFLPMEEAKKPITVSPLCLSCAERLGASGTATLPRILIGGGGGSKRAGRRGDAPRPPEQQPQQDALEGALAVDAVMVRAAEEGLRDLRQPAADLAVLGRRQVRREHARAGDAAVAGFEDRVGL